MFEIGECVVYGTNGICRVTDICPSPYDPSDTRSFYLLIPVKNPMSSSIYTPVDNDRVPIRRLMTAEEIDALILMIPQVALLSVPVEKQRRELYRATVGALRPEGYVSVIKTVRERQERLSAAHKHVPVSDLEYGRLAKHMLYSEISHVLSIKEESVEAYIAEKLGIAE